MLFSWSVLVLAIKQLLSISHYDETVVVGYRYEWFGQSSAKFGVGNQSFLAIGAPGHRNATGVTVGALHIYSSPHSQSNVDSSTLGQVVLPALERICTLEGAAALGEFGASVAASAPESHFQATVLAVGAPNEGDENSDLRGGAVRLFDLDLVGQSEVGFFDTHCRAGRTVQLADLAPSVLRATIVGPRLSRFGRTVQFVPLPASADRVAAAALLVAAPLANGRHDLPIVPAALRELGAVFGWLERDSQSSGGGLKLPSNGTRVQAVASASWHAAGSEPTGRLGSSLAVVRGGANQTSCWVVAGAPLASRGAEMGGAVMALQLT
eukprot:COSAG03_NODE_107_length_12621_cov_360.337087_13_plen_324_part_00